MTRPAGGVEGEDAPLPVDEPDRLRDRLQDRVEVEPVAAPATSPRPDSLRRRSSSSVTGESVIRCRIYHHADRLPRGAGLRPRPHRRIRIPGGRRRTPIPATETTPARARATPTTARSSRTSSPSVLDLRPRRIRHVGHGPSPSWASPAASTFRPRSFSPSSSGQAWPHSSVPSGAARRRVPPRRRLSSAAGGVVLPLLPDGLRSALHVGEAQDVEVPRAGRYDRDSRTCRRTHFPAGVAEVEPAPGRNSPHRHSLETVLDSLAASGPGPGAVALGILSVLARMIVVICPPNQVVIFSGRKRKLADGSQVGYRSSSAAGPCAHPAPGTGRPDEPPAHPDRRRGPERVLAGNIPLEIHAIANVKIAQRGRLLRNAVERFLGKPGGRSSSSRSRPSRARSARCSRSSRPRRSTRTASSSRRGLDPRRRGRPRASSACSSTR